MHKYCSLIFFCIFIPFITKGQFAHQSNFTIYNGLPSDHVYYILNDSYGYLWMATTEGVVRYNGYSFKTYNQSDGLPNNDVWYLFEDNKKRMWLSTLSTDLGYIYNGRYKKIYIQDTDARMLPTYMTNTSSGIIFSNLCRKNDLNSQICLERNDTLYSYCLLEPSPGIDLNSGGYFINNKKELYATTYTANDIYSIKLNGPSISVRKVVSNIGHAGRSLNMSDYVYGDFYITYIKPILSEPQYYNEYLSVYDLKKGTRDRLELKKNEHEHVILTESIGNILHVITDKNIYKYDSVLSLLQIIPNRSLVKDGDAARNVIALIDDPFWGRCVGTATNGAYIDFGKQNSFKKSSILLSGYTYAGRSADSVNFWWNKQDNKLMSIGDNGKTHTQAFPEFSNVKIISCDNRRSLLLSNIRQYWYDNKSGKVSSFFSSVDSIVVDRSVRKINVKNAYINAKNGVCIGNNYFLLFANHFMKYSFAGQLVYAENIDEYKYKYIFYDPVRKQVWAYNEDKILIYDQVSSKKTFINRKALDLLHISKVEQLLFDDKNGNIFIKDQNNFFIFDDHTLHCKELFTDHTLINSRFYLFGDMLIGTGKFGVFFSKILGPANVSTPYLYRNVKNDQYQYIYDVSTSSKEVLLNTDKGTYSIPMLLNVKGSNSADLGKYRLILNYQDSILALKDGDTINIKQFATSLNFDVINPLGSGTPKYAYRFGSENAGVHVLNAGDFTLPKVTPDNYYVLYLNVYDDVWKSKTIKLILYVQPYWWQSSFSRRAILLSALILLTLIVVMAIYITRRIEEQKNRKHSLQLGLELRAVYAQLNPHFIFNSLNLTLYLISKNKLDDAYTHVLKFSGLLRAYLRSCRNRFITIADEATNIGNYIQLQQMRFDNIFTYEIIIDPQLSPVATKIPALILQPIVENAINHGLLPKGKGGHLVIEFIKQENKAITINVDDNGVGRKHAAEISVPELKKADSYGSGLTDELIDIFNRYENAGIELNYIDKEFPLTGTKVQIEIKNPNYNAR